MFNWEKGELKIIFKTDEKLVWYESLLVDHELKPVLIGELGPHSRNFLGKS